VVGMEQRRYLLYNVVGSVLWVGSMMLAGYFLGDNQWVKQNFEKIVLGFGVFTLVPILYKMFSKRSSATIIVGKEAVEEQLGLNDPVEEER
jgi:membrane-associated protein